MAGLGILPVWRALQRASKACRCGRRRAIWAVTGEEPPIQGRRKAIRVLSVRALNCS